jgi:flagellar capping protein FliD
MPRSLERGCFTNFMIIAITALSVTYFVFATKDVDVKLTGIGVSAIISLSTFVLKWAITKNDESMKTQLLEGVKLLLDASEASLKESLGGRIDGVNGRIDKVAQELKEFRGEMRDELKTVNSTLASLDKRVEVIDTKLEERVPSKKR